MTGSQLFLYNPPEFADDKMVVIPEKHLSEKHCLKPLDKSKTLSVYPHYRGHHLWKG